MISQLESRSDIDLIIFDMNGWRQELVREEFIEDLSVYKGLVPQSVHPALVSYLQGKVGRYFLPFRPNVRLVFLKRKGFEDLDPERFQNLDREHPYLPRTWADVMTYAKRFYERDGEARIVIEATDADAPLFLLELIRTARGDPLNLQDQASREAIEFLHRLWPYVSPKSRYVDWETALGYLLVDDVYLVRNWAFSLRGIRDSGQDDEFITYEGLRWKENWKPHNLLGGDLFAVPRNAQHKEEAIELIRYLIGKEAQTEIVRELSWPAMRLDVIGTLEEWQQRHLAAINQALRYSEPVPDYWYPEMHEINRRMFIEIVKSNVNMDRTLRRFQSEIDQAGID